MSVGPIQAAFDITTNCNLKCVHGVLLRREACRLLS